MRTNYLNKFEDRGYAVFNGVLPSMRWFEGVYEDFDRFIDSVESEPEKGLQLRRYAQEWLKEDDHDYYYCNVPCSYRNRLVNDRKRDKVYLQWCYDFSRSALFRGSAIGQESNTIRLCEKLEELEYICSPIFRDCIDDLGRTFPAFAARFDTNRALPVIFKLVRYSLSPLRFATDPHYDKSALSLILNSDDAHVNWKIGKGHSCRLSDMAAPFDYPEDRDQPTDTILFPGLCLRAMDVAVDPAPHCVMPVTDRPYRHSIIAFLLIPGLGNMDALDTQAVYQHDILPEIH